jgi:hypothetical protein
MLIDPDSIQKENVIMTYSGKISRTRIFLFASIFLLLPGSTVVSAQVVQGSKYISTGFGIVEGDFSISSRMSGQFRKDMGVEVLMGFVPDKGFLSDIYSLVHFRYHLWPDNWLVPHVVGGAGAITLVGSGRREIDFVTSVGAGAAVFLTENVAVRADVENYTVFVKDNTLFVF